MDNNSNNNISGIPNVADIKFDDTPAQSFDNLYGNSGQPAMGPTPVAPVQPAVGPTPVAPVQPAVGPTPVAPVQPAVAPTPVVSSTDLSNMNIDAEKMQSIEEQLSKTSQYNPSDFQQEQITISTDNKSDKNKSGLAFVIVLFIILALVIAFLPQITKLIK